MIKNKIFSFSLLVLILVLGSSSLSTVSSNTSNNYGLSSISEPGNYQTTTIGQVLILYSDSLTAVDNVIATMGNFTVDKFDVGTANPTLTQLSQYRVVIVFNNFNYLNSTETGNVLADYVDAGGKVIQLAHTFSFNWHVAGRFYDENYTVFRGINTNLPRDYDGSAAHVILKGVKTFHAGFSMNVTLTPGSGYIAFFTDGHPMMGLNDNVIAINVYPGSNWSGDLGLLLENSINYFIREKILILFSDSQTSVDNVAATLSNYTVQSYDVGSLNPTLDLLSQYSVVIVFNNFNYLDSTKTGNVLADYLDNGGKVIQMAHTFSFNWHVAGRFYDENYTVFRGTNTNVPRDYDGLSVHPILNGVTAFHAGFSMDVTLTPGSDLIASFADGHPMMGIKNNIVALNVYPGSNWSGDLGIILENSINYLTLDTLSPTITGPVELLVELGDPSAQVQWLITDESAGSFNIYLNGSSLSSGSWTDTLFQPGIDLTPFALGTYEFQINTTDIYGNEATFTTIVYVRDTVAPSISSALDRYSYMVGSTLNVLFWQPSDVDPDTYVISRTDALGVVTIVDNGFWSDFIQIGLNIDGLEVGEYVYRAEFSDGSGNVGVAETIVIVEPEVVSSEPTGNTSEPTTTSLSPTTTSEQPTSTSEPDGTDDVTAELPLPFSNIYLIIFSIIGLTMISRKKKHNS